jgi:hypothetical protein
LDYCKNILNLCNLLKFWRVRGRDFLIKIFSALSRQKKKEMEEEKEKKEKKKRRRRRKKREGEREQAAAGPWGGVLVVSKIISREVVVSRPSHTYGGRTWQVGERKRVPSAMLDVSDSNQYSLKAREGGLQSWLILKSPGELFKLPHWEPLPKDASLIFLGRGQALVGFKASR